MMIRIPFQNRKTATGGAVSVFPGGDGRVDDDLLTRQQIGALFQKRNEDMDIIGGDFGQERLIHRQWSLFLDQIDCAAHRLQTTLWLAEYLGVSRKSDG